MTKFERFFAIKRTTKNYVVNILSGIPAGRGGGGTPPGILVHRPRRQGEGLANVPGGGGTGIPASRPAGCSCPGGLWSRPNDRHFACRRPRGASRGWRPQGVTDGRRNWRRPGTIFRLRPRGVTRGRKTAITRRSGP